MSRYWKTPRSFENYLDNLSSLDYEELKNCINSDVVWDNGYIRHNPTAYELFTTHEHLDFAKEDIFKFAGITLNLETFEALAAKVAEVWQKKLPELFPGHKFIIYKNSHHKQVAFCRQRNGITENPAKIIQYLMDDHHNIRWNALLSATLYPDPLLVPHILKRLDDDNVYNVLKAIIALGESKDKSVIPILKNRFLVLETGPDGKQFVDDYFAYDLFKTLIKLGDNGYNLVFDLFKKFKSLDINTLEYLCELLGKTGKNEVLDILLYIYFTEPEGCDCAFTGLLSMEKHALPEIIPKLSHPNPDIRKKAMLFIANCYLNDIRNYLLKGLKDPIKYVREAAVHGIGRFYHRTRKTILKQCLDDKATIVRVRAAEALGTLLDPKLLPTFQMLCLDKNPRVRLEAMKAAAALDSKKAMNFICQLFDQVPRYDKLRIIDSLYAYTGNPSYLKPIIAKALASNDKELMKEATELMEMQ
ncbi:HEAT repeat domain-containing protein [Phosphitispora sp. TUW77]|uniref:HEAT repeat domain-containing protein n=1 Tax=Phosphitispora sp. TUW77 TaxID=3152361 RepID=UPI003AB7039E